MESTLGNYLKGGGNENNNVYSRSTNIPHCPRDKLTSKHPRKQNNKTI